MAFGIIEGASLALSLWGSSRQARVQKRAIEEQLRRLRPYLDAREALLATTKGMLGRPSRAGLAALETSTRRIQQQMVSRERQIEREGGATGRPDVSGARWATRLLGEEALGELTTGYAMSEEQRQAALRGEVASLTTGVPGLGAELGLQKASAESEGWGAIADIIGGTLGDIKSEKLIERILGEDQPTDSAAGAVAKAEREAEAELVVPRPGIDLDVPSPTTPSERAFGRDLELPTTPEEAVFQRYYPWSRGRRRRRWSMPRSLGGQYRRSNPYSPNRSSRAGAGISTLDYL